MKIKDLCTYAPKSLLKAGQAIEGAEYMFFTSSSDESKRYNDYQFDCEGIIMGTGGNATLHYYCGKFSTSTDCVVLLPKDIIRCKYLYYFFLNNMSILEAGFKGASLKHTNKNHIDSIEISFIPSLKEQDKVIEVLDKICDVIDNKKEELNKLDDLIKARFVEMFGDPVTNEKNWSRLTLGDICEIGSSKRVFEKDYVPNGIPFFRTKEIVELSEGNQISTELFIAEEHYEELKKSYGVPKKDDLLVSAVGTVGTIWIVNGDFEFYFKDGNLIQIKASPNFSSIFMKYLLNELIANYKKEMSTGTAYSALTIAGLKKMLIYDVPLALQEQFAAFVEQIDKSKLAVRQSLEKTQQLYDSLMQEYFG